MLASGGEAALFGIARGAPDPPRLPRSIKTWRGTSVTLHFDPALRELHLKTVGTGQVSGADRDLLDA